MWKRMLRLWTRMTSRPWQGAGWSGYEGKDSTPDGAAGSGKVDPSKLGFEPDVDVRKLTPEDIEEFSRRDARFPEVPPKG